MHNLKKKKVSNKNVDIKFNAHGVFLELHFTTNEEIQSKSWYSYIYPEDLQEAKEKHTQCRYIRR
jgi:hypothetical protein